MGSHLWYFSPKIKEYPPSVKEQTVMRTLAWAVLIGTEPAACWPFVKLIRDFIVKSVLPYFKPAYEWLGNQTSGDRVSFRVIINQNKLSYDVI